MKKRLLTLSAAGMLLTSVAFADPQVDSVVAQFQELGYTRIEVKRGPNTLKIEAIRPDGRKREMIIDLNTSEVLEDETGRVQSLSDDDPDVEVKVTSEDYHDRYDEDDDEEEDHDDDYDDDDYDDESDDDHDDDHEDEDDEDDDDEDDDDETS